MESITRENSKIQSKPGEEINATGVRMNSKTKGARSLGDGGIFSCVVCLWGGAFFLCFCLVWVFLLKRQAVDL